MRHLEVGHVSFTLIVHTPKTRAAPLPLAWEQA